LPGPDIFLSYNREDQTVAKRFAEAFEAAGYSVWWDVTLRSGEAYDKVTEDALRNAKAVVVLWSPRSVDSRWVRAEATLADRSRTLVPARIEPCDLPIMFELTQTADLSHWHGNAGDSAWRGFLGDVRRMVGTQAEPERAWTVVGSAQPSHGRKPSIAVLPFINRSGVAEDDVFAIGMVDDLTAALSLSRRIKVIAASATAKYRAGASDLQQIGRDLGVRYLLEGNVRRAGDDLRVTAQLVEAEDGDILWTRKFDRPLAEVGALQAELVTEVAACLGVEVQRAEMEHALKKPGDITAWEAVLRAESHLGRGTRWGTEAAIAEARRAVEIDPSYDLGLATLAIALGHLFFLRGTESPGLELELQLAIDRACAAEPEDAVALSRIAAALNIVGRLEEALPFAERAIRVNPNYETTHIGLASILAELGRFEEADEQLDAAERVAPNGYWMPVLLQTRAMMHFRAGRLDDALDLAQQSLSVRYSNMAQAILVLCLAALGRSKPAHEAMRRLRLGDPDMTSPELENHVGKHLCKSMDPGRADAHIAAIRALWQENGGLA
jgi:TolB-like protein